MHVVTSILTGVCKEAHNCIIMQLTGIEGHCSAILLLSSKKIHTFIHSVGLISTPLSYLVFVPPRVRGEKWGFVFRTMAGNHAYIKSPKQNQPKQKKVEQ